jgi:hypothetical protein
VCVENPREKARHMTLKTCTLFPALMSIVPLTCHDRPYTEPERLLSILVILAHIHTYTHTHTQSHAYATPSCLFQFQCQENGNCLIGISKSWWRHVWDPDAFASTNISISIRRTEKLLFSFVFAAQCKRHFTLLIYVRCCCFLQIVAKLTRKR